jgi:hypothetical protein
VEESKNAIVSRYALPKVLLSSLMLTVVKQAGLPTTELSSQWVPYLLERLLHLQDDQMA